MINQHQRIFFSSRGLSLLVVRWSNVTKRRLIDETVCHARKVERDRTKMRSGRSPSLPSIRRSDFESVINNGFVKGYDVVRNVQQLLRVVARLLFFGSAYIIIGVYVHKTARQTCKCWTGRSYIYISDFF